MKKNEGTVDRLIRFVIGAVIVGLGIFYHSWWGLVGLIPIATAFTGTCMLYIPLKISTNRKKANT